MRYFKYFVYEDILQKVMNKLQWYINRLSLMSPSEIGYRIKEEAKKKSTRLFMRDFPHEISLAEKKIYFYFEVKDRDKIISFLKKKGIWNVSRANEILAHKFSFFSFNKKFLGKTINWHKDYKNDKEAPLKYCKDIDYRDFKEVGDFKYIWEINRHQHLISLAKAYYLTGLLDYKDEVKKQIVTWIEANPYMKGVNWTSALELSVRIISWSWVWIFLGELDKEFKEVWLECIHKHCACINQNFSQHSSANNHLIGEAAGLFIASVVWSFGKESELWKRKSFRVLVAEVEKQNYEDGVNKEQAYSYQQFVLDFFIQAGLLGEKNGIQFPKSYWQRIEKMLEFIASIMDKEGNIPNVGDSDDGYAVILSEDRNFSPYKSLLSTGAVFFNRGDFKSKSENFDEKSLWLLGIKGWEQFNLLAKKRYLPIKSFEKGGYFVLGANEDTENEIKVIFDCGPLGYLSIAAHGHADTLSFILTVAGREFIIDPGTYIYQTPKEWRDYFKGTAAHNTLRIDGVDQSVSGGNFMWIRKAQARVLRWESNDAHDLVDGEHYGYLRLKDPLVHKREIFFDKKKNLFKIVDKIKAKKMHLIEQFFHFSEKCTITKINQSEWEVKNNDKAIVIKVDKKMQSKILNGSTNPIFGWRSKKFDVKEKTFSMINKVNWEGTCELETIIFIK